MRTLTRTWRDAQLAHELKSANALRLLVVGGRRAVGEELGSCLLGKRNMLDSECGFSFFFEGNRTTVIDIIGIP